MQMSNLELLYFQKTGDQVWTEQRRTGRIVGVKRSQTGQMAG